MASDQPQQLTRPFSVTLMVILLWINSILYLLAGAGFLVVGNDSGLTQEIGADGEVATGVGWFYIVFGLIIGFIAIRISKGGTFWRMVLTILLVLSIVGGVLRLFSDPGPEALLILFNVIIIWLMWNTQANAFFTQKKA